MSLPNMDASLITSQYDKMSCISKNEPEHVYFYYAKDCDFPKHIFNA